MSFSFRLASGRISNLLRTEYWGYKKQYLKRTYLYLPCWERRISPSSCLSSVGLQYLSLTFPAGYLYRFHDKLWSTPVQLAPGKNHIYVWTVSNIFLCIEYFGFPSTQALDCSKHLSVILSGELYCCFWRSREVTGILIERLDFSRTQPQIGKQNFWKGDPLARYKPQGEVYTHRITKNTFQTSRNCQQK